MHLLAVPLLLWGASSATVAPGAPPRSSPQPAVPRDPSTTLDLLKAAQRGDAEEVQSLLGAGADPNKRIENSESPMTPLVLAAEEGFADGIRYLVLYGADVDESWYGPWNEDWGDTKEPPQTTALFHAATSG